MSRLLRGLAYYLGLLMFFVFAFLVNLFCFLLLMIPGSRKMAGLIRIVMLHLLGLYAKFLRVLGVIDLRVPPKTLKPAGTGRIWVMNHPSILDASYLITFITGVTFIYKQSIQANPFYGATARYFNYIPNIGGPDMVRLACRALQSGNDLVVFPEGTRSTRLDPDLFRPLFALIAKRAKTTVNLLWVDSPEDFLTREVPLWKIPSLPARVEITQFGEVDFTRPESVSTLFAEVKQRYEEKARGET